MTCARLLRMTDYDCGCGCGIGGDLRSTSTSRTIVGSGPRRPSRAHALPLKLSGGTPERMASARGSRSRCTRRGLVAQGLGHTGTRMHGAASRRFNLNRRRHPFENEKNIERTLYVLPSNEHCQQPTNPSAPPNCSLFTSVRRRVAPVTQADLISSPTNLRT